MESEITFRSIPFVMHSDYFSRVLIVTAILVTIKERVTSSTTTENANCTFTTVPSLTNALNLTSNSNQRVKLSIAGFYSRGKSWDTSGVIPAVELALDHINHRADILEDYELDVIWENSNVSQIFKYAMSYAVLCRSMDEKGYRLSIQEFMGMSVLNSFAL